MIILTGLGQKEESGLYIGRPNPLGNPYNTKQSNIAQNRVSSLQTSLKKYRIYLLEQLCNKEENKQKKIFKVLLNRLRNEQDIQLNCWCCFKKYELEKISSEYECHGEVIIEILFDLKNNNYNIETELKEDNYYISGKFPIYIRNWIEINAIEDNGIYILKKNKLNETILKNIKHIIRLYQDIQIN